MFLFEKCGVIPLKVSIDGIFEDLHGNCSSSSLLHYL